MPDFSIAVPPDLSPLPFPIVIFGDYLMWAAAQAQLFLRRVGALKSDLQRAFDDAIMRWDEHSI